MEGNDECQWTAGSAVPTEASLSSCGFCVGECAWCDDQDGDIVTFSEQEEKSLPLPVGLTVYCVPLAKYRGCCKPFVLHLSGSASFAELQMQAYAALVSPSSASSASIPSSSSSPSGPSGPSGPSHQSNQSHTADYTYSQHVPTRPSDIRLFRLAVKEEEEEECEWMSDLKCLAKESPWVREQLILHDVMRKQGDGSAFACWDRVPDSASRSQ